MNKNRKFTQTFKEAKELFFLKTGKKWNIDDKPPSGITIFKLKIMKTKTRRFFVGTYLEWLNL